MNKNRNNNKKMSKEQLDMGFVPNKKNKELIDPMNPLKSLKKLGGNSAFKIVPEGLNDDDSDKFAALGDSEEEEIEDEGDEQFDGE